ncbi:MAG: TolC family protein [Flavobacteriales bacterium]|nr:TolC family protein [Flavobacteriales bacterium]
MNKALSILLLLISFVQTSAQTTSLTELLVFAHANSPTIKNASLDVEIAKQKIKEYTSAGLPKINGSLNFQNYVNIPTTVIPASALGMPGDDLIDVNFGTDYNSNLAIQVDQLIFSARYIYGIRAANAYASLTELIQKQTMADFNEKISTLYYSVLLINKNASLAEKGKEQMQNIYDYTKKLVDGGVVESSQLDEVNLMLLQTTNVVNELKMNEELSMMQLKSNIGYPLDSLLNIVDDFSSAFSSSETSPSSFNVNQTLSFMLASQNTVLNELDLKVVKSEGYPSISGFFSHQEMAMRKEFSFFDNSYPWYPATVWGLRVDIPIFNSGEGQSKRTQKELSLLKSQNELSQIETQISALLMQLENNLKVAKMSLDNANKSLELAEKVLQNEIIKFKAGTNSVLAVSQAQNQVIAAQQELLSKEFNVIKSQLAINKITNK